MQRSVETRLADLKISTISFLRDMKNAFQCTAPTERDKTLEELTGEDLQHELTGRSLSGHRSLFKQRYLNNIVELRGHDGTAHVMPRCGNIIGSAEGPIFFSFLQSFHS